MSDLKFKNIMVTFYREPNFDPEDVQYFVGQEEICPRTGRRHWQYYFQLRERVRQQRVKTLLNDNTCHIEVRRGTHEEAEDYCTKPNARFPDDQSVVPGTIKRGGRAMSGPHCFRLTPMGDKIWFDGYKPGVHTTLVSV